MDTLQADLTIAFDYTRSLGPVLGRFMAGLRDRRVLGGRTSDGRVHVPPLEYDPTTYEPVTDLIEVAPSGTVISWTWTGRPLEGQPLDRPFGWALIRLDGADTPLLHAVDAGSAEAMRTGMRVRIRWAADRAGHIRDIECFTPERADSGRDERPNPTHREGVDLRRDERPNPTQPERVDLGHEERPNPTQPERVDLGRDERPKPTHTERVDLGRDERPKPTQPERVDLGRDERPNPTQLERVDLGRDGRPKPTRGEGVEVMTTPIRLRYRHTTSVEEDRYLRALADGRIVGQRCPTCQKVYVPPRVCPADGVAPGEVVEVADRGTVTTFCVVNVPFAGQRLTPPYVVAQVLLDGADIPVPHLILGVAAEEVRMGLRVAAVWRDRADWGTTPENIDHFAPAGEPDAAYETYAEHL